MAESSRPARFEPEDSSADDSSILAGTQPDLSTLRKRERRLMRRLSQNPPRRPFFQLFPPSALVASASSSAASQPAETLAAATAGLVDEATRTAEPTVGLLDKEASPSPLELATRTTSSPPQPNRKRAARDDRSRAGTRKREDRFERD